MKEHFSLLTEHGEVKPVDELGDGKEHPEHQQMPESTDDAVPANEPDDSDPWMELNELKALYLETILAHSHKINEGNNGIILEISDEDFSMLMQNNVSQKNEHAVSDEYNEQIPSGVAKVIKIYNENALTGKSEFENQHMIHALFEEERKKGNQKLARIPKPLLYRDVELSNDLARKLNDMGAVVKDRAEVIIMEKIEGIDMATDMYRSFLKYAIQRDPKLKYLGDADDMDFHDLHQVISDNFFYRTESPQAGVNKMLQDEHKIAQQNAEMLTRTLGKAQYTFSEERIQTIEASLALMRQSGIALRDAHERNFMIGDDGSMYILDFGDVKKVSHKVTDDDFDGYRMDKAVPLNMRKINKLSQEEARRIAENPHSWQDKDAGFLHVHVMSKARGFAKKDGTAFGMSKSREKIDPRVEAMEEIMSRYITELQEHKSFDAGALCRELIKNRIKPKKEEIPNNTLINIRAFLGGLLYKAYEAYIQDRVTLEDCGRMYQKLKEEKLFAIAGDSSLGIMPYALQDASKLMAKFAEFREHAQ